MGNSPVCCAGVFCSCANQKETLIASFMGPTLGQTGANRTRVGRMNFVLLIYSYGCQQPRFIMPGQHRPDVCLWQTASHMDEGDSGVTNRGAICMVWCIRCPRVSWVSIVTVSATQLIKVFDGCFLLATWMVSLNIQSLHFIFLVMNILNKYNVNKILYK